MRGSDYSSRSDWRIAELLGLGIVLLVGTCGTSAAAGSVWTRVAIDTSCQSDQRLTFGLGTLGDAVFLQGVNTGIAFGPRMTWLHGGSRNSVNMNVLESQSSMGCAVDPNDNLPAAFGASISALSIMKWSLDGWIEEVVDPSTRADPGKSQLLYSKSGRAFCGYVFDGSGGIRLAERLNGTWMHSRVDTAQYIGVFTMAIDSTENPHFLYYAHVDSANYVTKLFHSYRSGGVWKVDTVAYSDDALVEPLSMGADGTAHIGYGGQPPTGRSVNYFGPIGRYHIMLRDGHMTLDTIPIRMGLSSVDVDKLGRVHIAGGLGANGVSYTVHLLKTATGWLADSLPETPRTGTVESPILHCDEHSMPRMAWRAVNCPNGILWYAKAVDTTPVELSELSSDWVGLALRLAWTWSGNPRAEFRVERQRSLGFEPLVALILHEEPGRFEILDESPNPITATVYRVMVNTGSGWREVGRMGVGVRPVEASLSVGPNPMRSQATIQFSVARTARVAVDLFDVAGRRVRRLFQGFAESGAHSVLLDLASRGQRLPAGSYRVRLSGDYGLSISRGLVVLGR